MDLRAKRRALQVLINERNPLEAMVAYYAFYHADDKTTIITHPDVADTGAIRGFVILSRTGMDLFRPFLTMRLPIHQLEISAALLQKALPPNAEAFVAISQDHAPLLRAFCDIRTEESLLLYALERGRLPQDINILVTREDQHGLPRFVIKQPHNGRRMIVAAAGLNWQTRHFAEIAVRTHPAYRQKGFGRAVVQALSAYVLARGRTPLYAVNPQNTPSIQLAKTLGFADTGGRELLLEVQMRPISTSPN